MKLKQTVVDTYAGKSAFFVSRNACTGEKSHNSDYFFQKNSREWIRVVQTDRESLSSILSWGTGNGGLKWVPFSFLAEACLNIIILTRDEYEET